MIERGRGDIVNVSSMGVHLVAFGVGAYSASKAALELFTEALYVELPGTGVRAHLVVPGTTATEFSTRGTATTRPSRPVPPRRRRRRWRQRSSRRSRATNSCRTRPRATPRPRPKGGDPNAFLAQMREALAGLRGV